LFSSGDLAYLNKRQIFFILAEVNN